MKGYLYLLAAFAFLLSGCGGGGSGSSTPTEDGAQAVSYGSAVYYGSYDSGMQFYAVVLPNDMFYAIDGETDLDGSYESVLRLVMGQGASSNGKYIADVTAYTSTRSSFAATINATYVPKTSLSGSLQPSTGTASNMMATALPSSTLDFHKPASMSDITGTWTGRVLDIAGNEHSGILDIDPSGRLTGYDRGCWFFGTITPDTEKNFFNVSVTYGAGLCLQGNQSGTGIIIEMLVANGAKKQLVFASIAKGEPTVVAALR